MWEELFCVSISVDTNITTWKSSRSTIHDVFNSEFNMSQQGKLEDFSESPVKLNFSQIAHASESSQVFLSSAE